jgi:protoporphyrinogen oxidase
MRTAAIPGRPTVILGGGLTGLMAARTLQRSGTGDVLLFEKDDTIGGHARSIEIDGYTFDYGPHILFAIDSTIRDLIHELLGTNLRAQERQAFIYHEAHSLFTRFPFQAHLFGLPSLIVKECLVSLVRALEGRARGEFAPGNYEEWIRGTFGDVIAETMMIPYARKLWTVPPSVMDFNWIGSRVPTPDVDRIIAGALSSDVEQIGTTANFWYPWRGGIESLARSLSEGIEGIHLGQEVRRIHVETRSVELAGGKNVPYESLVFTLPLAQLPEWIPDLPADVREACGRLTYQGILNINLGLDRPVNVPYHWVYFYEDSFPFHRLSFPANFSPHNVPPGKSSISLEIAYDPAKPLDTESEIEKTIDALERSGIVESRASIELVHSQAIAPAYVVYDLEHAASVNTITSWLAQRHIRAAGRFGEWQYLNMDQAMKSGKEAAEWVLEQGRTAGSSG